MSVLSYGSEMSIVDSTNRTDDLVEIKLLREADLPVALQLEERELWNQTEHDWKRILQLCPQGCFAAFCAGELVGTVTTITYGRELAWIGMMLVTQEHRGRGIGKQLMRAALDYCQDISIAAIKLDATPAGRPLYESLGFVPEGRLERWQGEGRSESECASISVPDDKLRQAIYELDDQAFYTSRQQLLNYLLQDCCVEPAVARPSLDRSLQGYALARRGARASYIGPIIAVEPSGAVSLLDSLLGQLAGKVFLDIPISAANLARALLERGFGKQRDLTRMSLGGGTGATSNLVFAIAGPELG